MMQEKNIQYKGQSIFYRVTGQGQAVMLVHGFAEDGTVWENQAPVLEAEFKVIIPDLPGSGKSPIHETRWSMEYFAECLHAILQQEQIAQVTMIGHSMGGYITPAFAEKYPDALQAFGLFHSTAYPDNEEKIATRRRGIQFIRQNGAKKFLEQSIPNLFSGETKKLHPELVRQTLGLYTYFQPEALIAYYEAMIERPDRTHVLKNFPRPVLFILGKQDTAVPFEQGLQQCHLPGISYVKVFDNAAHMGMMEAAEEANKALVDFCSLVLV